MKRIVIVTFIMCAFSPAFTQNDLIDRVTKQAVEIDSLKKIVKAEVDNKQQLARDNYNLQDTIKRLKSELANLEEFRKKKKSIDTLLRQKTDSIVLLKAYISEKDKQIVAEKDICVQKSSEEYEKGKNEILSSILNNYKNKSFEELLKSSSKQSAQRDLKLVENTPEVKQILSDIEKYYSAKDLLNTKVDAVQIKNFQIQLGQIKRESALLNKLNEMIGNYQNFNDGLKETMEKIIALDNREAVSGMSKEVQKKKFDKILAEVSSYIFNYDFNFSEYPYLSDIFLELLKRKQPNPDADITDLLKKL